MMKLRVEPDLFVALRAGFEAGATGDRPADQRPTVRSGPVGSRRRRRSRFAPPVSHRDIGIAETYMHWVTASQLAAKAIPV